MLRLLQIQEETAQKQNQERGKHTNISHRYASPWESCRRKCHKRVIPRSGHIKQARKVRVKWVIGRMSSGTPAGMGSLWDGRKYFQSVTLLWAYLCFLLQYTNRLSKRKNTRSWIFPEEIFIKTPHISISVQVSVMLDPFVRKRKDTVSDHLVSIVLVMLEIKWRAA